MLMPRFVAVSICGLVLATSASAQTTPDSAASRGPKVLSKSIRSGLQSESPTGHVRRALH